MARRVRGALGQFGKGYLLPLGPAYRRDAGLSLVDLVTVMLMPEGPQREALHPGREQLPKKLPRVEKVIPARSRPADLRIFDRLHALQPAVGAHRGPLGAGACSRWDRGSTRGAPDDSLVTERMLALLSGFFGILALLLASVGLYVLLAYSVEKRRSEIGVRLALAARPGDVLAMVLRETALLVAAGLLIGLAVTVVAGRWIATLLYGLTPADPATLALTVAALATVGGLSAWIPARNAARSDPMIALQHG
jgi:hypothetical protein